MGVKLSGFGKSDTIHPSIGGTAVNHKLPTASNTFEFSHFWIGQHLYISPKSVSPSITHWYFQILALLSLVPWCDYCGQSSPRVQLNLHWESSQAHTTASDSYFLHGGFFIKHCSTIFYFVPQEKSHSQAGCGIWDDINGKFVLGLKGSSEIFDCVSEVLSHLGRMFGMNFRVQWGQTSPKS